MRGDLLGRDVEIARASDWFVDSSLPLATVTGPLGVGKSCLALELADRFRHQLNGSVVVVDALRVRGYAELVALLADRPGPSRDLLVLDGWHPPPEGPHLVCRLLEERAGLRIMVTSSAPLGLDEEWLLALEPFPVPEPERTTGLRSCAAVQLFCRRAREVTPGFAPADVDLVAIARLCARAHGLPLGIELLASRMVNHTPSALLGILDRGPGVSNEHLCPEAVGGAPIEVEQVEEVNRLHALTPRECEVLKQLITGATNEQIGRRLGMSTKTAMHHISAIYRKLGVHGRAGATAFAFRSGLTR